MKNILLATLCAAAILPVVPRLHADDAKPVQAEAIKHWRDARFGMFIHWGPVSLTGREIGWSRGQQTPVEEYDNLYKKFNPVKFNADEWVAVAKAAGMKYMVLTTKHHDGFCLWDTKQTDHNIMNTPFKRDVTRDLAEACKKAGIAFGVYYSTCDWYHPDFPLTSPGGRTVRPTSNLDRYNEYLLAQTKELLTNYGPLFTLWYDVPQKFDATRGARIINMARAIQPDIVINNRIGHKGDYDTPEQKIGGFQMDRPWETCMTICNQWAWKPDDKMKSLDQCIGTLIQTNGGDGNLLFNVGPTPEGEIEARQIDRLKEMGAWLKVNGEAIYGTRGGPIKPTKVLASTRKGNKIFLHVMKWDGDGITIPALPKNVLSARMIKGDKVVMAANEDGITFTVAEADRDPVATVIELTIDGDSMDIAPIGAAGSSAGIPGAKASASNVYAGNQSYAAGMAIDGDPETRWATDAGTSAAWLEIDFGKPASFDQVFIDEATEGMSPRVEAFELQVKEGDGWKTIMEGKGIGANFASPKFPKVTASVFRLNILKASDGPTIDEISFGKTK